MRSKNEARPQDIVRVLRSHHERLEASKYLVSDLDDVVIHHADFLCEIFTLTARPTRKLLEKAALEAYDRLKAADAAAWARQMAAAVAFCTNKLKSFKTGAKLHADVRRVCVAIRDCKADRDKDPTASPVIDVDSQPFKSKSVDSMPSFEGQATSSTAVARQSVADLKEMYGVASPTSKRPRRAIAFDSPMMISSQEAMSPVLGLPDKSAASSSTAKEHIYMDNSCGVLVRQRGSSIEKAEMRFGANGFLEARFSGEIQWTITEVPNLIKELVDKHVAVAAVPAVRKKPAAAVAGKKKATANQPEAMAEATGDDSVEEAGQEEDVPPTQEYGEVIPGQDFFTANHLKVCRNAKTQSYITGKPEGGSKYKLIVAVSQTQSENHRDIIANIEAQMIAKKRFTKPWAINCRSSLLAE